MLISAHARSCTAVSRLLAICFLLASASVRSCTSAGSSRIGSEAYRLGSLIEVPLTSVFTGALRGRGPGLYPVLGRVPHGRGIAARSGLLQRIALTPEDMPIEQALAAVRIAVRDEGQRLLTFSFHSPSLEPGHTPYVRDARDLDRFWHWWDRMFAELDALGVRPTTLEAMLAAAEGQV